MHSPSLNHRAPSFSPKTKNICGENDNEEVLLKVLKSAREHVHYNKYYAANDNLGNSQSRGPEGQEEEEEDAPKEPCSLLYN